MGLSWKYVSSIVPVVSVLTAAATRVGGGSSHAVWPIVKGAPQSLARRRSSVTQDSSWNIDSGPLKSVAHISGRKKDGDVVFFVRQGRTLVFSALVSPGEKWPAWRSGSPGYSAAPATRRETTRWLLCRRC